MKPETELFTAWYEKEVKKGLIDIKFTLGDGIDKDTTQEDFAAENNRVNRIITAKEIVERPDVF
ncbi:MAG: hypothetical protein A6F71_06635 [Cycloclasticus sp. symbiont of Poecilosclerida sp. M]|nr:MAG: hypothetical protein A6F71_06635 [Cycloclasticus sp. symbiont of Poecilosclerida sp. M]